MKVSNFSQTFPTQISSLPVFYVIVISLLIKWQEHQITQAKNRYFFKFLSSTCNYYKLKCLLYNYACTIINLYYNYACLVYHCLESYVISINRRIVVKVYYRSLLKIDKLLTNLWHIVSSCF